jgi:hypothetical protein
MNRNSAPDNAAMKPSDEDFPEIEDPELQSTITAA